MKSYHYLVNKSHLLREQDRPNDLVEPVICFAPGVKGEKRLLREEAAQNLEELFLRAEEQNICLYGVSAFRSFQRQEEIYQESLNKRGKEHTERYIAPPGGSEHQTGLAIDLSCKELNYELEEEFSQTEAGIWLEKNASLFGFILRYPKGKEKITGYAYEPWHIRYVTKGLAFYLRKMELTLEEYWSMSKILMSVPLQAVPE